MLSTLKKANEFLKNTSDIEQAKEAILKTGEFDSENEIEVLVVYAKIFQDENAVEELQETEITEEEVEQVLEQACSNFIGKKVNNILFKGK